MTPTTLRTARRRHDLNQATLAAILDTHVDTVSRWERGTQSIPRAVVLLFAAWDRYPELLEELKDGIR